MKHTNLKIKGNYHIHTTMSDGAFTPEEITEMAIKAGLDEIGFCDHYFTLKGGINYVDNDQIDAYIAEIKKLRQKYIDKIRILAGLEIDTSCFNTKRSKLPVNKLNELDFVLFEYVEDQNMGELSKQQIIQSYLQHIHAQITQFLIEQQGVPEEIAVQEAMTYMQRDEKTQNQIQVLANRRSVYSLPELLQVRKNLTCAVGLAHPDIKKNFAHYDANELAKILVENDIFIDACSTARNSVNEKYDKYGEDWKFTPFFCGMEEYKIAFSMLGVAFAVSTDTHSENNIGDTLKAELKINQYDFTRKSF